MKRRWRVAAIDRYAERLIVRTGDDRGTTFQIQLVVPPGAVGATDCGRATQLLTKFSGIEAAENSFTDLSAAWDGLVPRQNTNFSAS
ncbi:MAG TPA: hypothetical protein VHZ74_00555 [Bryobacteraceae bacterium]|nr:hypothetical protein [Bryobacteraceae bacterium]